VGVLKFNMCTYVFTLWRRGFPLPAGCCAARPAAGCRWHRHAHGAIKYL